MNSESQGQTDEIEGQAVAILEDAETGDGSLSVLSASRGHLEVTFEKGDRRQTDEAKRIINDMLARGYIITVLHEGEWVRATGFNRKTNCYRIDTPEEPKKAGGKPKRRKKELPVAKTKAVGIAPTGGG